WTDEPNVLGVSAGPYGAHDERISRNNRRAAGLQSGGLVARTGRPVLYADTGRSWRRSIQDRTAFWRRDPWLGASLSGGHRFVFSGREPQQVRPVAGFVRSGRPGLSQGTVAGCRRAGRELQTRHAGKMGIEPGIAAEVISSPGALPDHWLWCGWTTGRPAGLRRLRAGHV